MQSVGIERPRKCLVASKDEDDARLQGKFSAVSRKSTSAGIVIMPEDERRAWYQGSDKGSWVRELRLVTEAGKTKWCSSRGSP